MLRVVGTVCCAALVAVSCSSESSDDAHPPGEAGSSNANAGTNDGSKPVAAAGMTATAGTNATGGTAGTDATAGMSSMAGANATAGANAIAGAAGSTVAPSVTPIARRPLSRRGRLVFDRYSLRASFDSDAGYPEYSWHCHLSVIGGCEFERCTESGADDKPEFVDAGALTVTNLTRSKSVLLRVNQESPSSSEHLYGSFTAEDLAPMPGDEIRITAAGSASVPSFETTVVVPANSTVSSPTGNHTFSLVEGLRFRWSGSAEFVRAAARIAGYGFEGANPSFKYSSYCVFPGASGDATLPAQALSSFQCDGFGTSYFSGVGESQLMAGDYAITIQWLQPQGESLIFTSQCTP